MTLTLGPQAPELEEYVIAAVMWHSDAMVEVADILRGEHFADQERGVIWDCLLRMFADGRELNALSLLSEVSISQGLSFERKRDMAYRITRIQSGCLGRRNMLYNTLIIGQCWIARKMMEEGGHIIKEASDWSNDALDLVASSSDRMNALMSQFVKGRSKSYHDAEASAIEDMGRAAMMKQTTGFRSLDTMIGGYQCGDLVIVAARPAMGKSAFAFSSAGASSEAGSGIGFISLELMEDKGQARLLSRRTGIPVSTIIRGEMTDAQVMMRHANLTSLKSIPLHMRYSSGMSLSDLRTEVERMKRKGVKTVFIDQLNWITAPKEQNRDRELGVVSRTLKLMAAQLDVCIVLLHQLSREVEKRGDKRPVMSDLRDSGNIEQDAQIVLLLYRPEYYGIMDDSQGSTAGVVDVIVAKNTNGSTGSVRLRFDGPTASIHDAHTETFTPAPF